MLVPASVLFIFVYFLPVISHCTFVMTWSFFYKNGVPLLQIVIVQIFFERNALLFFFFRAHDYLVTIKTTVGGPFCCFFFFH